MKNLFAVIAASVMLAASCCGPKDGEYNIRLLTTNDVHGRYFDTSYETGETTPSLMSLAWYIDSVRVAAGSENVVLIEAGDFLHDNEAAYYHNYIDIDSPHVYGRLVDAIGYDAVIPGNHDFETGHQVYDRLVKQMETPFLAANAICTDDGKPYFKEYVTIKRHGLKITIIGFTNPNNKYSLSKELWAGMDFESMMPTFAQEVVDRVTAKEKSDVVIVTVHSGAGQGDGSVFEQQGLDLYKSLKGVDFLVCSHDHRAFTTQSDNIAMVNTGNYCANLGYGTINVKVEGGKVLSKKMTAGLIKVDKNKVHQGLKEMFKPEYETIKEFATKQVCSLDADLRAQDAFRGTSDYMNLMHSVMLGCESAQISFASPLTNSTLKAGKVVYKNLVTLYPKENLAVVVKMTGSQVKAYLEHSYDNWINTISSSDDTLLKISGRPNPWNGKTFWTWTNTTSDFESAAGIVYDVDVTKPMGERILIKTMADGSGFDMDAVYNVAMSSYRTSGGGKLLQLSGIDMENVEDLVVGKHGSIRTLLYEYLTAGNPVAGDVTVTGEWKFVPEALAQKALDRDMDLVTPRWMF